MSLTGVVDNVMAGYVEESVKRAADEASPALIITINTPGGSLDATQRIVSGLLEAPVPTIVWVSPSGARAASAGTFITLASNLAYMAPGTNIGAASPVGSGGEDITGTIGEKVTQRRDRQHQVDRRDARSQRRLGRLHGRQGGLVVGARGRRRRRGRRHRDLARGRPAQGRWPDRPRRCRNRSQSTSADAPFVDLPMNPFQSILHLLSDPNIAFILLTIGFYGLIFELQSPNFVTGILGAIALILAFIGFGSLPLNVAGVLLIGLAIVLFVLEFTVTSHGLLFVGGLICFVLGAFALYTAPGSPTAPDVAVATPLIVFMATLTGAFVLLVLVTIVRSRRRGLRICGRLRGGRDDDRAGRQRRRGQDGARTARRRLHGRRGVVGPIGVRFGDPAGESVRVVGQEGLTLIVEPAAASDRTVGTAGDDVTSDQILPGAIVAVIVILIVVGVFRAATRRRGANEDEFGAGGVSTVAVGTRGVATTDLAPSGVVLRRRARNGPRQSANGSTDRGRDRRPRRPPGWADTHRRTNACRLAGARIGARHGARRGRRCGRLHRPGRCCSSFFAAVQIVNQYERLLVFTLGRTSPNEVKGPGWVFVVPIAQRGIRVDLRERFIEVPSQTGITKDNAPISIDFLIYWRIVDPYRSVIEVQDFEGALQNIATTTLRAVVGDILLDDVLSKREQINEVLRVKLDEVTERWGGKVTTVEIREITPPRDVQDAMNRQLSAERTRRAVITESEGTRQSAINVAEGTKQAEILRAEGDRQAAILRAEGFALALGQIYAAASQVDQKTMALQYLEAFKALGASPSTKYIIPLEITQLAEFVPRLSRERQRDAARGLGSRRRLARDRVGRRRLGRLAARL